VRCLCLPLFTTVTASIGDCVFTDLTGDTRIQHEDCERFQRPHLRHKFEQSFRGRADNNPKSREKTKERHPQTKFALFAPGQRHHGLAVMPAELA
jgi:hypothetical protein